MSRDLNILKSFKDLEPKEEDIPTLSENAMKNATALTNPRNPKLEEVIHIIKGAMQLKEASTVKKPVNVDITSFMGCLFIDYM